MTDTPPTDEQPTDPIPPRPRLTRSTQDTLLGGVAGGIGRHLEARWDERFDTETFEGAPVVAGLQGKIDEVTSKAVEGSHPIPSIEPPGARLVEQYDEAVTHVQKADQDFVLKWLADDLQEFQFQKGGTTKGMRAQAFEDWRPGDPEAAKYGFGMAAARGMGGTSIYHMLDKLGLEGSYAEKATRLGEILRGEANNTKVTVRVRKLADLFKQAWDGKTFDFAQLSDEAIEAVGLKRSDLKRPQILEPNAWDGYRPEVAARWGIGDGSVAPLAEPFPPASVKRARPLGRDVIPKPAQATASTLNDIIDEVKTLGPMVTYKAIRNLRQQWDQFARKGFSPISADQFADRAAVKGAAAGRDVLREAMSQWDPSIAAANVPYHIWKTTDSVLGAAAEAAQGQSKIGRQIAARVMSSVIFGKVGGVPGMVAGTILAPGIEEALSAPTTKLKTARMMTQLATAIRKGDLGRTASTLHRLEQFTRTAKRGAAAVNRAPYPEEQEEQ